MEKNEENLMPNSSAKIITKESFELVKQKQFLDTMYRDVYRLFKQMTDAAVRFLTVY